MQWQERCFVSERIYKYTFEHDLDWVLAILYGEDPEVVPLRARLEEVFQDLNGDRFLNWLTLQQIKVHVGGEDLERRVHLFIKQGEFQRVLDHLGSW